MTNRKIYLLALLMTFFALTSFAQNSKKEVKEIAAQFIQGADEQNGDMLLNILEPSSWQYVLIGDKVNKFTNEQYITSWGDFLR